MSKFISLVEIRDTGKTKQFDVRNGSELLGEVKWYSQWRRYVFFPYANRLFDASCLTAIAEQLVTLMDDRKATKP